MIAVTASIKPSVAVFDANIYGNISSDWHLNEPNIGLVSAYQILYERNRSHGHELMVFMHDDISIHDTDWPHLVAKEFGLDPKVAIVGLGGSKGIGHSDIYRTPYAIHQLARVDYMSNQTDAEIHGRRFTGATDVAVIDGFFCAVRTSFLDEIGGFKWIMEGTRFHNWDNAMCLEAWRRGYRVRMTGISCTHHGGGTSTTAEYAQSCRDWGTTIEREHQEPHIWLYSRYQDLLPLRIR